VPSGRRQLPVLYAHEMALLVGKGGENGDN
jgi:hypothetical protein